MASMRKRTMKRQPRVNGPTSECYVIRNGEVVGTFTPKTRTSQRCTIVPDPDDPSKLMVRVVDL